MYISQGLRELVEVLPSPDTDPEHAHQLARRVWIARFDENQANLKLANRYADSLISL